MTLLQTEIATPLGKLNLIADQHVVLAANLSSIKSLRESLSEEDFRAKLAEYEDKQNKDNQHSEFQ